MKYICKKTKEIKQKIVNPLNKHENKYKTPLSRGGAIERSHKKRVGDIVNKNITKRYDAVSKALERIENDKKKKKKKLKEEIVGKFKFYFGTLPIHKIASKKDIAEINKVSSERSGIKYIKFIATKSQKLFVFNPILSYSTVATNKEIRREGGSNIRKSFWGMAKKVNKKWYYVATRKKPAKELLKNYPWIEKFFVVEE